jgi:hypothetical protein
MIYKRDMRLRPTAIVLLLTSIIGFTQDAAQPTGWKEYVYREDGFAITLPSDPHPHKTTQMPNGLVYLVPLPSGGTFSIHTMEANDKCEAAVHSQKDNYEKHKVDGTTNGFRAVSFREVSGGGYTGVEFIQQVPNGRMDYERWVCGAHHLYVLASGWKPEESEPKELRRIVDSFRVLTDK